MRLGLRRGRVVEAVVVDPLPSWDPLVVRESGLTVRSAPGGVVDVGGVDVATEEGVSEARRIAVELFGEPADLLPLPEPAVPDVDDEWDEWDESGVPVEDVSGPRGVGGWGVRQPDGDDDGDGSGGPTDEWGDLL